MLMMREKLTFGFILPNGRLCAIQMSLEDPWLLPRCDRSYMDGRWTLFGWLFLYFGWLNEPLKRTQ